MELNPDFRSYLIQAGRNEKLADHLYQDCKRKCFYLWVMIAIYHSAMQYFFAFLASRGEKIPQSHKTKNNYELGDVDLAKEKFCTNKDDVSESVVDDYETIFQWSNNVRYRPKISKLIKESEVKSALLILERVKLIVANETGYLPVVDRGSEKSINAVKVKKQEIISLRDRIRKIDTANAGKTQ
jgi:hypothetical protein